QATAGESPRTRADDVMNVDVLTVTPDTPTLEAFEIMQTRGVSCLPVVGDGNRLVGILSESDLIRLAAPLLRDYLKQDD
ncbi:MAG: CBS domain-containing protein, partial [Acidobacteriota bacterium]|nr:CBS domain-containing protein [Acidobacteriota bacterium]